MSLLGRIRTKPKEERAWYSFLVASIMTGIIAMVWMTTIPARFTTHVLTLTQKQEKPDKKDTPSGVSSIFDSVKDQFANTVASQKKEVDTTAGEEVQAGSGGDNVSSDSALTNLASSPSLSTSSPATTTDTSINTEVVSTQHITATTSAVETVVTPPPPRIILIGTTTFQKSE